MVVSIVRELVLLWGPVQSGVSVKVVSLLNRTLPLATGTFQHAHSCKLGAAKCVSISDKVSAFASATRGRSFRDMVG